MDGVRIFCVGTADRLGPCGRCGAAGQPWDRIADQACCPDCEESLVAGEGAPLVLRTEPRRCCVCDQAGTVAFRSAPLHRPDLVEFDLCPGHFRDLLARRLRPFAYHQLRRALHGLGITVEQVFLLHEAFYDPQGKALQPVVDSL
jgi:hypothetical protein